MGIAYQKLDPLIHQPARLSIMAALAVAHEVEFSVIRDAIKISDSLLSRYMSMLEKAGYIKVRKAFVKKRPKTWLSLTKKGKEVYENHVALLKQLMSTKPL